MGGVGGWGPPDSIIWLPHYSSQKYKHPCAKVWQSRGVFIFWLFARSPAALVLPDSLSQTPMCVSELALVKAACLLGRKPPVSPGQWRRLRPTPRLQERRWLEIEAATVALRSQEQYLRTGYWLCGPAAKQTPPLSLKRRCPQLLIKQILWSKQQCEPEPHIVWVFFYDAVHGRVMQGNI